MIADVVISGETLIFILVVVLLVVLIVRFMR